MSWNNLHPGLVMILFGIIILALPEKCRKYLTLAGSVCAFCVFWMMDSHSTLPYKVTDNLTLQLIDTNGVSMVFLMVFVTIGVINAIYSMDLQNKWEAGITCIYAGSNMGIVLAGDLISFIVFWEISAFASTYIIYARHCRRSSRAAFRYVLVHAFGGNMLLAGILVQIFHNGVGLANLSGNMHGAAFWLILIGIGVNAAIPPFNGWIADAYPEATIPGTVYLGSYTTKAAIYALITFFSGTHMLIYVGAFMAIFAACMALLENDIRRLLSYHIVSQLGMMVASLGVGSEIGVDGASAHAVTNIFFKGVLLMCAGSIMKATGTCKITELGGLRKKMPITAFCFLISSMAIAGFPFLSGFASKALIMESLHEYGEGFPAIMITIAGVGTLLSITLKINYFVFFGKCDRQVKVQNATNSMTTAVVIGTIMSIVIGMKPELLYQQLTYKTMVDPFSIPHIMEYVAIIAGGAIPFFFMLSIMKPHDEISMDFDWFYRRPLVKIIEALSKGLYRVFGWFDRHVLHGVQFFGTGLGNPYLWTEKSGNLKNKSMSFENEDRLIGDVIQVIVALFAVMILISIYVIKM